MSGLWLPPSYTATLSCGQWVAALESAHGRPVDLRTLALLEAIWSGAPS